MPALAYGQPWCMLDDPAWFRDQMTALFEDGGTDITRIQCPTPNNPHALPEELVLPMPCGRQMLFRKVVVGAENLLDQEKVYLGNVIDTTSAGFDAAFNGPNVAALSGGFTITNEKPNPQVPPNLAAIRGRAYYIGKYEVTQPQYEVFQSGLFDKDDEADCNAYSKSIEEMNESTVRPASGLTWFEAVEFTRRYNLWLIRSDAQRRKEGKPPYLPWEQGSTSYVRLPGEAEWEYAARGGFASAEAQGDKTYKIRDPDNKEIRIGDIYEISPGDEGGLGEDGLMPVGLYYPNLLGIYDMVGNAEEILLEPYRMTRPQRDLHGQIGGYIVKGGLPGSAERLGVGERREVPFFTAEGEPKAPSVGFRVALSVPVRVDGQRTGESWHSGLLNAELEKAITDAIAKVRAASGDGTANVELEAELKRLREEAEKGQIDHAQLEKKLQSLQARLEQSNAVLQERERDVLRGKVRAAVLGAYSIAAQGRGLLYRLTLLKQQHDEYKKLTESMNKKNKREQLAKAKKYFQDAKAKLSSQKIALDASASYYFDLVLEIAEKKQDKVADAVTYVRDQFTARKIDTFRRFVDEVSGIVDDIRSTNGTIDSKMKSKWMQRLDRVADKWKKIFKELEI